MDREHNDDAAQCAGVANSFVILLPLYDHWPMKGSIARLAGSASRAFLTLLINVARGGPLHPIKKTQSARAKRPCRGECLRPCLCESARLTTCGAACVSHAAIRWTFGILFHLRCRKFLMAWQDCCACEDSPSQMQLYDRTISKQVSTSAYFFRRSKALAFHRRSTSSLCFSA